MHVKYINDRIKWIYESGIWKWGLDQGYKFLSRDHFDRSYSSGNECSHQRREGSSRKEKGEIKYLGIKPLPPDVTWWFCCLVAVSFSFPVCPWDFCVALIRSHAVLHGSGPSVFSIFYFVCCILAAFLKSVWFHGHLCLIYYLALSLSFDFLFIQRRYFYFQNFYLILYKIWIHFSHIFFSSICSIPSFTLSNT